jgi:DivIVA domain-containing protein
MEPEDIEGRDFFVGLRGYDRDEVNTFLTEVASQYRAVLAELEMLRNRPPTTDPFEHLGANVTAILRSANDTAAGITTSANEDAEAIRASAEAAAEHIRREADEYAGRVRDEVARETETARHAVEDARAEAGRIVDDAREQAASVRADAEGRAGELVADAESRAAAMVSDAEARAADTVAAAEARVPAIEAAAEHAGRQRAAANVEDLVTRLTDATRQQEAVRARLSEASDEIQLALMALGDPVADPTTVVADAVREVITLEDTVSSE